MFFQTPEEQRSWLYDAYYKKERYSVLATWDCSVVIIIFMQQCVRSKPLALPVLRLIDDLLKNGHLNVPRIEHPLYLRHFGLPTLFFVTVLVGACASHYGRLWLAGTVGLFSTIGIIKMALSS